LDYKFVHVDAQGARTHSDEHETRVSDAAVLKSILSALGFRPIVVVDKTRSVFNCGDFHVCVDEVAELGSFAEIEAVKDFGGVEKTLQEVRSFAHGFGSLLAADCVNAGYPDLVLTKRGLFKLRTKKV